MAQRPLINSENQSEELIRHTKMPVVPGKCFARCLIPDSFAFMNVVYLEYQGSYPDQAGIEIKEILILPARTEWIRREFVQGVDKGCCMGADPCLIWALEEIPAEIESFYHVVDTNSIKNYSRKIVTKSIKLKEGGYTDWREVLCEDDSNSQKIKRKVRDGLNRKGYYVQSASINISS